MASKIQKELALIVTGKDVSATKTLRGVNKELNKLGSIAAKGGANVARNIERAVVIGGAAAVGAIGYAIQAAQSFESATAGVAKTIDGDITDIVGGLRKMSTEAPLAYEELAAIAEAGGALGIAKGDILSFTDTVARLAVTTDLTSEAAATSLGGLKTTLKLTGNDFRELGDELVYLGNNGASTESEILSMAESISGAANVMDASKEQVLGWASAVANTREEAEAGGSSIQRFWLESFKSVQKGGSELRLMAKTTGMTAAQFKRAFGKDATGTLATFITSLGKVSKAEQLATLEKLGFTDIRVTRALLKLLGNTDNLAGSLVDVEHAAGAMGEESEKRFATSASQMKILENNVRDAAATIGTELLPVVNELANEGVDWLQGHQPEIKQFAEDLAGNIREAVTWARSLDWDAIGGALGAGAGFAADLVEAFASAPPWVQQFLAGGFVANKFTGGAVGSVLAELGKGLIKGVLGINAGVVNVNAGVVNGGGVPGGKPGIPGATGGVPALFVPLAVAAAVVTAGVIASGVTDPRHQQLDPKTGKTRTFRGTNVAAEQIDYLERNLSPLRDRAAGGDRDAARQLAAIEARLVELRAEVARANAPTSGGLSPDERQVANDQRRAIDRVWDSVEKNRLAVVSALGAAAQYQAQQAAFAIRDIVIPAPEVTVNVDITARSVEQARTSYQRTANRGRLAAW
ncbi:MAG: phage tail tape measure protein [Chloroflexota bacterium]